VVSAFEQTTEIGAVVSSTHDLGNHLSATYQYAYTDTRTNADRAVSCTRFGFCRLEDVASFLERTPQHSIGATVTKNPLVPTENVNSGYRWQAETKLGHAVIGNVKAINFGRMTFEIAAYHPLSDWFTLAWRAQVG